MKLLLCRCSQCKACRKHSRAQFDIVYHKRSARRKVRCLLHLGKYDALPIKVALPYFG